MPVDSTTMVLTQQTVNQSAKKNIDQNPAEKAKKCGF
jgi:hypothetical protein